MAEPVKKVQKIDIRMYKMGTGDCFVVKFHYSNGSSFNMMIDAGTWSGSKNHLQPYVKNLKEFVDNRLDLLIVTHEHKDHVHVFDVCRDLFLKNFTIEQVWLGWSENELEKKVATWKKSYGDKKKALANAAQKLNAAQHDHKYKQMLSAEFRGMALQEAEMEFAETLNDFSELHFESKAGEYIGPLQGMIVVKEIQTKDNIKYLKAGEIIEGLKNLPGIKIYVLGPPNIWDEVQAQEGNKEGDTYKHNKEFNKYDAFAATLNSSDELKVKSLPFNTKYKASKDNYSLISNYEGKNHAWRKIDYDWLHTSGSLALRINSFTNNLSVALAVELEESGKVLLFPGDAEWGSWDSWHRIPWNKKGKNKKVHLTTDLLNRTVFYKVAHHLSHNGTALNQGMKLMTNPELIAMATLDYNIISTGWKSTMPNEGLINDLLAQTKGRLLVMNTEGLYADAKKKIPLSQYIDEAQKKMTKKEREAFENAVNIDELFIQFTLKL